MGKVSGMRAYQKKEIFDILNYMYNIEEQCAGDILTQETGAELQDCAVRAGTMLEGEKGHREPVHELEQYCELVYQSVVNNNSQGGLARKELLGRVKRYIVLLEADKNKIVFMPYKFCMWDSMESIYHAACKEQGNWEVKVHPLPYRYKDGGSACYEGEYFQSLPGYISYEEYDLEKEKPDIIVIHNPYDQYNQITEVFGDYFSTELRKHTKRLVYVPYYINQQNNEKVGRMILPGIKNATDIFVQSEEIRKQYLHWNPGKNVYAVGSPKIDRIVNAGNDSGIGRHTFFLNTHLIPILEEPETFLERTEKLLLYFRERPEISLIWRPHPMSLHTFEKQENREAYQRLLLWCEDIDNISLDQSEDFISSLIKADAYIGDRSSLMVLFGMQGKPMYIYELEKKGKARLECLDACIHAGRVWLLGLQTQMIFSVGLSCEDVVSEYALQERGNGAYDYNDYEERFHYLRKRGDDLFLFPGEGQNLLTIHCATNKMERVSLMGGGEAYANYRTQDIIEFEGGFYIFPGYFDSPLLWFDGKEVYECKGWIEAMRELAGRDFGEITESVVFDEGKAWIMLERTNRLICTSLEDLGIEYYDIPVEGYFIDVIQKQGRLFWMAPSGKGKIVVWSVENGIEREYDKFPQELKFPQMYAFTKVVCFKDSVWFLPRNANGILILDVEKDDMEMISLPENFFMGEDGEGMPKFCVHIVSENRMFLPACDGRYHLIVDIKERKIVRQISAELSQDCFAELYKDKNVWLQKEFCALGDFIEDTINNYHFSEKEQEYFLKGITNPGSCGEKIWERICGLL